ncbi:MAG: hypothetical protein IKE64_09820 [Thermoguttaceae bacterium]|nr:hypothetical protein [Thermoguttaceae bacterium]
MSMERTRRLRCEPLEERLLLTSVPPAGGIEETAVILCGGLQAADSPASVLPGTEAIRASLLRRGADPDALTEDFIFALDSCPSASCTIYLDFTGHTTTGTRWNSEHDSPAIVTPAYDLDGDPASFSNVELLGIYEIWLRVSEDFAPFEVSVTTRQPQAGDLIRTDALDARYGIRCCVGGSDTDWYNDSAGGVAYVGSFTNDSDTPCFIFSGDQSTPKAVAETVSHEVGHSLGLSHDGIYTDSAMTSYSAYYRGTDGWAPIMGSADNAPVSQWSRGEYPGATNTEEDLAIILGNGFSYRADDIGDTFAAARTVTISSSEALSLASGESVTLASGIIERSGDIDFFRLVLEEKLSSYLVVGGVVDVTNLNANVCLYDADYQCLGSYNPTAWMNAAVDLSGLLTGTYYLSVEGSAQIAGDTVIFSDYASIGAYTLELTDQLPCADVPDSIGMALDLEWEGDRAVHTDLLGNGAAQYFSSGIAYRDVDMYRFSVAPSEVGTDYTFTLFQTSGWNLSVRIFDDQGNELTSAYRWEEEFSLRFTPQRGGCYYLGICLGGGYDPHSSTGIYYTGATPFEVTVAAKRQQKTSELSGLTLSSRTPSPGETLTAAVTPWGRGCSVGLVPCRRIRRGDLPCLGESVHRNRRGSRLLFAGGGRRAGGKLYRECLGADRNNHLPDAGDHPGRYGRRFRREDLSAGSP